VGYTFGVGREAPRFGLHAADGSEIELAQYRGDWLPVIVFFRHDDAATPARLAALAAAADQLWGFRGQVLGVAVATPAQLAALDAQAGPLSFPLLADEDGRVARAYDAWNAAAGRVRDVTYIVDKSGKIVWVGQDDDAAKPAVLTSAFRDIAR
jgi:thioredoxin-dependent peroxiredoxin